MFIRMLTGGLVALLALSALPAGAEDPSVTATATRDGDTAVVSGQATFVEADGPFDVGGTRTGFAHDDAANTLGINLQSASVDVTDEGVAFTWQLSELEEVPPEAVRYTWAFTAGGQEFQLQAKRSNVASITTAEDPVGHAQQAQSGEDWFQLRGACEAEYQGAPVSGCYHLAFLDGSFDTDANTVTMLMPFETTDRLGRVVAPGFTPGAEIVPVTTANSSITATVQAMVSNTTTESYINDWETFFAGAAVQGFVGDADDVAPSFLQEWEDLDLSDDGSFSGTLSTSAGGDTVHLRACNLNVCARTSVAL